MSIKGGTSMSDLVEAQEMVVEAQDKLRECVELLKSANQLLGRDRYAEAYLIEQLAIHVDEEHGGMLSNDLSIEKWLEEIGDAMGDAGEEESDDEETEEQ